MTGLNELNRSFFRFLLCTIVHHNCMIFYGVISVIVVILSC